MSEHAGSLGILRNLESSDLVLVAGAVVLAWLLASAIRWVLRRVAEWAPLRLRLPILRMIPLLRLVVGIGALVVIVPILVEPTFQNGVRAVHLVTAYDNEVIIPHSRLWSKSISNATSGSHSVLCVANFYLHPDHDGEAVRRRLVAVGETSGYLMPGTQVNVVAQEKPWGTHYKLKAYVKESRDQFDFVTDLTLRGKEALRVMSLRFAQAPYAEVGRD